MEFKSLKNIEYSFRTIRVFAILFTILLMVISGYSIFSAYRFANEQRQKIYVLDNGKSLILALSQDESTNRPVEAKEHVRRFHEFFFTLAPDREAIKYNVDRALQMCDESAYNYYKDMNETGYYQRIISNNINQRMVIDSIICNFDTYPYEVLTYGKQIISRKSNTTVRSLLTYCHLKNAVRSDNNPQGFAMESFRVVQNENIPNT